MLKMSIEEENIQKRTIRGMLSDLKYLVKGFVLVANVLPVLSGFWIALYFSETAFIDIWETFLYLTIGSTLLMAGALILNNWYEVDLDTEMERTQKRPTVTGHFSMRSILWMGIIASIVGVFFLFYTTTETAVYGILAWFAYVVMYTFWTKRRYTLNTVVGSLSGAFTPLMGWAAVTSAFHLVPIVLFIILFIWQIPHTFAIAMRRHDEYKAANVPMLPVVHGFDMTKRQNAVYIACLLPFAILLYSVSIIFVIILFALNVYWFIYALRGIFQEDNKAYANHMFYISLLYLFVLFVGIVIVTLPVFG